MTMATRLMMIMASALMMTEHDLVYNKMPLNIDGHGTYSLCFFVYLVMILVASWLRLNPCFLANSSSAAKMADSIRRLKVVFILATQ